MIAAEDFPTMTGVYAIRCAVTRKVYIGSSINIRQRLREHLRDLKHKRHANAYLQHAWEARGQENFGAEVLRICLSREDALEEEKKLIVEYDASNPSFGFNMARVIDGHFSHSAETREHLSKILIGHKRNVGRPLSDEHRAKISAFHKGRRKDPLIVEKVAAQLRGRKQSAESIAKRVAAHLGRKNSPETIEKMRAAAAGRRMTELIEKSAALRRGKSLSAEWRLKIAAGNRIAWISRKEKAKCAAA